MIQEASTNQNEQEVQEKVQEAAENDKLSGAASEESVPDAEESSQSKDDQAEESGQGDDEASLEDGKKPFFGKKKDKAVRKLEERVEELEDARVRQLAEFENFRKRSEKEKGQMFEVGAKSVVEKILPVIDNFERGLDAVPEEEKDTPFVEGIAMVYKQMLTALEEIGVKPIEAVGQEFDPNFHNAVMTVEDDELDSGMVAEELQKGYLYQDSVVRHSMVKVVS